METALLGCPAQPNAGECCDIHGHLAASCRACVQVRHWHPGPLCTTAENRLPENSSRCAGAPGVAASPGVYVHQGLGGVRRPTPLQPPTQTPQGEHPARCTWQCASSHLVFGQQMSRLSSPLARWLEVLASLEGAALLGSSLRRARCDKCMLTMQACVQASL